MFLSVATTAFSVGMGCGTCCSPVISLFLSAYVAAHAKGSKKGLLSFFSFFTGKLVSVSILCMAASFFGRQFIDKNGYMGSFNFRFAAQIAMSMIGIVLVCQWIRENRKGESCKHCHGCGQEHGKSGGLSMFAVGIVYGITPCAPLLFMVGYAFSQPIIYAVSAGIAFGMASMLSPVLLLVIVTGSLSKKMSKEIPDQLKWFRLASYLMLFIMPFLIRQ